MMMLISTFSLILFPIYIYVCSNRMTKYSPQTPHEQAKNAQGNESCRWVCSTAQLSLVPCWRFCLLDICVHSPRMPLARKISLLNSTVSAGPMFFPAWVCILGMPLAREISVLNSTVFAGPMFFSAWVCILGKGAKHTIQCVCSTVTVQLSRNPIFLWGFITWMYNTHTWWLEDNKT